MVTQIGSTEMKSQHGFSVIDLLVAVAIIGILGTFGLPQLSRISATFNRLNARTVFIQDLKQAQAQALTEGCRGIFLFTNSGNQYSYGCDYLPYDSNATPAADASTFQRFLPNGIQITPAAQIIFNSRGLPVDSSDIIGSVGVTFVDTSTGSTEQFANGTLLGTGLFQYN